MFGFLKEKLDPYDRFIIISHTDLFLLQKEDAIKKLFDFCCMTHIDYKSIANKTIYGDKFK